MLRADFEASTLWQVLDHVHELTSLIRAEGYTDELASLETIDFYASNAAEFRSLGGSYTPFFSPGMLASVEVVFDSVASSLSYRSNNGYTYTAQVATARREAEESLVAMAPWPRPYARGGQVKMMDTLFEDLLEKQRLTIAALEEKHRDLRAEIDNYRTRIVEDRDTVVSEVADLQSTAATVAATVDEQKARVDEVIQTGIKQVGNLTQANTDSYEKWQRTQSERFKEDFAPLLLEITSDQKTATTILTSLQQKEAEYFKLVSAVAAGSLADTYQKDARWGRRVGIILYVIGVAVLGLAAIPLVMLADPSAEPTWQQVVVRLSIGVLAASGATVLIRLGARFLTEASANKRSELEFRTFEPFLSTVGDRSSVDTARLELVDKTFGRPPAGHEKDGKEDAIPVSAFSQIVASLTKLLGR